MTQSEKAQRFRAMHGATFVLPNPWDAGSARLLVALGYPALATSSYAAAGTYGKRDGALTRNDALASARQIAEAVDVPVSGDLENGFGDAPPVVQETIRLAAAAGLVGGSIEDATGRADQPIYDFDHAVERVAAAVAAARALPFSFVLTARAENFVRERPDLGDTIRRLQAFERAGADVLFAPGLPDLAAVRAVCQAVTKPVNVVGGSKGRAWTVAELRDAGVTRISLATCLYRVAMGAMVDAAREIHEQGTFARAEAAVSSAEITPVMGS